MVHNRPLLPDHLSVSQIQVAPPCPSSFDEVTVEEGGFYAWPLSRIRSR